MSKYGNKKIQTPDGTFDSKKEYARWQELKLLEKARQIYDLERQVRFVLIPSQRDEKGKVIERECSYIADFVYIANDGSGWFKVVEDVKSPITRTPEYRIKKKLLLKEYGIRITEV